MPKIKSPLNQEMPFSSPPVPGEKESLAVRDRLRVLIQAVFSGNSLKAARAAGIEASTLHRIVRGDVQEPRLSTVERLATAFGVPLEWLLGLGELPVDPSDQRANGRSLWLVQVFNRARQQPFRDWLAGARPSSPEAARLRDAMLELHPLSPEMVLGDEAAATLLVGVNREHHRLAVARLGGDLEMELLRWGIARLRELEVGSSQELPSGKGRGAPKKVRRRRER